MNQEEIAPDFESGPLDELAQVLPATTVRELTTSYYESVASCFAKLDAAAIEKDWSEIKEQAHDLKGISGTFGAKRLQQMSDELEHMDFDKDSARVPAMLETMKQTSATANAAIEKSLAVSAAA
jgi:HPt (histidine-containing phosphotransfer) domain-containing protein